MAGVVPFRNLPLDATFRRATQPATLWRKVADRFAIIDGARDINFTVVPGREACWPAERLTRRRHGDSVPTTPIGILHWQHPMGQPVSTQRAVGASGIAYTIRKGGGRMWHLTHTVPGGRPEPIGGSSDSIRDLKALATQAEVAEARRQP